MICVCASAEVVKVSVVEHGKTQPAASSGTTPATVSRPIASVVCPSCPTLGPAPSTLRPPSSTARAHAAIRATRSKVAQMPAVLIVCLTSVSAAARSAVSCMPGLGGALVGKP